MPAARSAEERRWWRLALAYLGVIYLSLWPLQFVLDFLRARNLLRLSMAVLFLAAGAVVVRMLHRRRAGPLQWTALVAIGAVYAGLGLAMPIVQERLHLIEYGLLALLFAAALDARHAAAPAPPRRRALAVGAGALGLTTAAGWIDELIQGILPNRQYDLRDVGFNAGAAALALAASAALALARRLEARRRGGEGWTPS